MILPPTYLHYNDVIMCTIASQITRLAIFYSTVYLRRKSKKTSKLFVTGLCAGKRPTQRPVTRKMFPFDDVITEWYGENKWWRVIGKRNNAMQPCSNLGYQISKQTWECDTATKRPKTLMEIWTPRMQYCIFVYDLNMSDWLDVVLLVSTLIE